MRHRDVPVRELADRLCELYCTSLADAYSPKQSAVSPPGTVFCVSFLSSSVGAVPCAESFKLFARPSSKAWSAAGTCTAWCLFRVLQRLVRGCQLVLTPKAY